jgi:hypothetical protein
MPFFCWDAYLLYVRRAWAGVPCFDEAARLAQQMARPIIPVAMLLVLMAAGAV